MKVVFRQGLVVDCRCLEKRLLVLKERIDSFSVLAMWKLGLFLEQGVGPCLESFIERGTLPLVIYVWWWVSQRAFVAFH